MVTAVVAVFVPPSQADPGAPASRCDLSLALKPSSDSVFGMPERLLARSPT